MKKNTKRYRADGGSGCTLGPADKAAVLSIAKNWDYKFSDKAANYSVKYWGKNYHYASFSIRNLSYEEVERDMALFSKLLGKRYIAGGHESASAVVFTDGTYKFDAQDVWTVCREMAREIEPWPDKTTRAEDREKGYRAWAMSKNYLGTVRYQIPFDATKFAQEQGSLAAADSSRAIADKQRNEAEEAKEKAKSYKAARIGIIAAVGAVIVALIVKIAKK